MSKRKVIVDIDTDFVTVTESLIAGNKVTVEKAFSLPTKSEWFYNKEIAKMKNLVGAVVKEMKDRKIKSKSITILFPSDSVRYKIKKMFKVSGKQMNQFIKGVYLELLGGQISVDSMDITHVKSSALLGSVLSDAEVYSSYIVAIIGRTVLEPLIAEFKNNKIKVNEVCIHEMESEYFGNILGGYTFEDDCRAYINVGKYETSIDIVHKGVLAFNRRLEYGTESIIQSIIATANIDVAYEDSIAKILGYSLKQVEDFFDRDAVVSELEDMLQSDGVELGMSVDSYYDIAEPIMGEFMREVNRTMMAFESDSKVHIKSVFICGYGTDCMGIVDEFRTFFNDKEVYSWRGRINVDTQLGLEACNSNENAGKVGLWSRNKKIRDTEIATVMGLNSRNRIDVLNGTDGVLNGVYYGCISMTIKDCMPSLPNINLVPNSAKIATVGSIAKGVIAAGIACELVTAGALGLTYWNKYSKLEKLESMSREVDSLRSQIENNSKIEEEKRNIINAIDYGTSEFPLYDLIKSVVDGSNNIIISSMDTEDAIIAVEGSNESQIAYDEDGNEIVVDYTGDNKTIIIRGYAKDAETVANLMRELEKSDFVVSAEVTDIGMKYTQELNEAYVFESKVVIF